ncbi:1-deoxy-D-xylulose-5-phosphate synthase N-terminal domain-containing protein [Neobacillus sp.]|uniref:transketolase n=1 Tax=Neobacillus sp. TaxID=2675273 RepID=UPI00289EFEDC|nr:1-deoxy-D-xylulose-5-phosphate synthase N-terminal domain-containing protein [Neobacillus sp.]
MSRKYSVSEIQNMANNMRKWILKLTIERKGGYLSQACSSAETIAALYTNIMNLSPSEAPTVPPKFPGVPGRNNMDYLTGAAYNGSTKAPYDRLIFSPAHYAVVVYSALVESGRMAPNSLDQFNVDGSTLEMIGAEHSPGFECTTGSLGQAISVAGGIALARKLKGEQGRIFTYMSDGEFQEGQTWEALQAASFYKLDNLVVFVDVNGQQLDGYTKDVMNIEPLSSRCESFGARVISVNGHDIEAIIKAAEPAEDGKPLVVLSYSNSSQGIPMLEERKPFLHYVRFKSEEEEQKYLEFMKQM